jgi:hypothetical protein
MTSAIVTTNINALYPVAGQDNNSQGFRDNFSHIKTGLTTAASEITDLQTHSARTDTDNNFNGVKIENAETNLLLGTVLNVGTVPLSGNTTGIVTIDVRDAEYFTFTFTDDLVIRFSNWVSSVGGLYTKVKLVVKDNGTARDIGFSTTSGTIVSNATLPITTSGNVADSYVFEAWSINGGNIVFVNYVGEFN